MIPREGKAVHESIGRVAAVDAENARGLAVARVRDRHILVNVPVQVVDDAGTPIPTAYPPDIRFAQRARNFIGADLKGRYPVLGSALALCGITPAYAGKSAYGYAARLGLADHPRLRGEK